MSVLAAAPALAEEPLPHSLASMIREANRSERRAVINVAKRLHPKSIDAINELERTIEKQEKSAAGEANFLQSWSGEATVGGFITSGNTDEWGVSASASIKREGPRWTHELELRADVKEEDGERTEEQGYARYTIRRTLGHSRWFAFGRLSFERDRFQGIDARFFESLGVGYRIAKSRALTWDVMAGPALRQTRYSDDPNISEPGAFMRTKLVWKLTDTLRFSEELDSDITRGNTTFTSTTALTANLYGRLSGRISYSIETESDPPAGREQTDTYTRVSLVFVF